MNKTVLIVSAHPDDEVLGCGGTVARLVAEGAIAYTLIFGEGITSRDKKRDPQKRRKELSVLKNMACEANKILGVKKVIFGNFPDNRFDEVALLDIIKEVEEAIKSVKPIIIFTHFKNDLNVDHRITYQAVITATRPIKGQSVKKIYSFENLSSTEWNYPLSFSPNVFWNIEDTINQKVEAMKKYKTEIKDYPHPRSIETIKINAKNWGTKVGLPFAEVFELAREIK